MNDLHRSGCPINLTLEALGDKRSLIVVRDISFGRRRRFPELLTASEEGIASNILADRLQRLVELGVLSAPRILATSKSKSTARARWACSCCPYSSRSARGVGAFLPASEALSIRAELLERGGSELLGRFMAELRAEHLCGQNAGGVREELRAAYEAKLAKTRKRARQPGASHK